MKAVKKIGFITWVFIVSIIIVISLLSTLYNNTGIWWIKLTNFPRQQLLLLAFIFLLLMPVLVKKLTFLNVFLGLGLLSSIFIHGWFIYPYTPIHKDAVISAGHSDTIQANRVSLLTANVFMKNRNADKLLQVIAAADPDIIILQETDLWWQQAMKSLRNMYAYVVEYPLDNTYGMLLFSRLSLTGTSILFLEKPTVPSIHTKVHMRNNRVFILHAVHPVPPVPSERYPDNQGTKAGELNEVARMVNGENLPSIVAGDFNDVAWSSVSRVFQKKTSLKDVRTGRNFYNSFSAESIIMRWPLDHFYINQEFRVSDIKRLEAFGSDHFPMFASFVLPAN